MNHQKFSEKWTEDLNTIKKLINQKFQNVERLVVAIDGNCGSGKTTLADALAEQFDSNVIRMDDFFLPPELRTKDRLLEAGGNVHYERFVEEVITPLSQDESFDYRVFCCHKMDYIGSSKVEKKSLTIVEGAYSMRPDFRPAYDLNIFVTCDREEQYARILKRNGDQGLKMFQERWIPMEDRYFQAYGVKALCDIVLDTSTEENEG